MKTNYTLRARIQERLDSAATHPIRGVLQSFDTSLQGLSPSQVENARETFGKNTIAHGKEVPLYKRLISAFINPFTCVLLILALVSIFTDIVWADPGDKNPVTVIIITVMVLISGCLRFVQETRSGNAAQNLKAMIRSTACIKRQGADKKEIPMEAIVVGDILYLSAGDMVPADVRMICATDCFISQSSLTGESEPVEKTGTTAAHASGMDTPCLAYMGSTVISGSATAVVLAVGTETLLGQEAQQLSKPPVQTSFEKGVNAVSWVLIRFMLVMVPVVLFVNGFTKGDWTDAALFAISVAVGLTPEMLPMIVTTCLSKGAVAMSREKVIIKNLNAIQNLGSIDILCTDKTGTLTQDQVALEYHLDISGQSNDRVLRHAFLNSYYQTGLKNLMDIAIIDRTHFLAEECKDLTGLSKRFEKVDEIPFDFERRRMSVVVKDASGKTQMITKGAIEEMLAVSSSVEYNGTIIPLEDDMRTIVLNQVDQLNADGMRVFGVAQKNNPSPVGAFCTDDEKDMVLIGYLAFLDPPKETTASAIKALKTYGVGVKILTGDNEKVTACICRQVGLPVHKILLGPDIAAMDDTTLGRACEATTLFAKLSPSDKSRIVSALRDQGHNVGYMGDGINDASAMKTSDVGISVDTAVDIARESADVILLKKDLMVLERGIVEGRKTYANMIKYIKMTASSNFGNMFSVLAASAFLPFLPMASLHLILLNMIYDISCTAIPWDNVDASFLRTPRQWDANSIARFMLWIGPTSSVFDITTYLLMNFILCPALCGGAYQTLGPQGQNLFVSLFQTGWFIESMWSQTLVIHMIRTPKVPFIQSHASAPVTLLSATGIAVLTSIPFSPLGTAIALHPLPAVYFLWLALILSGYMVLVNVVKKYYIRRYHEWL